METKKIGWIKTLAYTKRALLLWWKLHPAAIVTGVVYSVMEVLIPYMTVWFSARIVEELSGGRAPERLLKLVLTLLILEFVLGSLKSAVKEWHDGAFWTAYEALNRLYNEKLYSLDFADMDSNATWDLFAQIQQNAQWSSWGMQRAIYTWNSLVRSLFGIGGGILLTWQLFLTKVPKQSGKLTIMNHPVFLVGLLSCMIGMALLAPFIRTKAFGYWAAYSDKARFGNRTFGFFGFLGYRHERALDIRMYRQDIYCRKMMIAQENNSFGVGSGIAKAAEGPMGFTYVVADIVDRMFTVLIYLFVCLKAWAGAFGVGAVTQYISAVTLLYGNLVQVLGNFGELKTNAVYLEMTYEFLDIPNKMYQGTLTTEKRSDCNYEIEFQDVSFKYPGSSEYVLKNVSLRFRVGQKLAIVGENGSGKTTFIKLLCRLYDPDEGRILLNGIDIRKYDYREYMSVFSVVFQDFKLLAFPLGQNVAAGVSYDEAKVWECLEKAGLKERAEEMEKGLNTCLYKEFEDDGVEISGGEAQKIAIARAIYKDAAFLILDEPTAALDPVAEYEIYSKFNEIAGERTAVYISHRLSSCRFCDEILVFDGGRVCQKGSHEQLLAEQTGKYYELWNAQAQYYVNSAKKAGTTEGVLC